MRLQFPPAALTAATPITIDPAEIEPPAGFIRVSPACQLGPSGIRFDRAVEMSFALDSNGSGAPLQVALSSANGGGFELLPATRADGRVVAFGWHFSSAMAVVPVASDSGTDAGSQQPDAGATTDAGVDAGSGGGLCPPSVDAGYCSRIALMLPQGGGCVLQAICSGQPAFESLSCASGNCTCNYGGSSFSFSAANDCSIGTLASRWTCQCGFAIGYPIDQGTCAPVGTDAADGGTEPFALPTGANCTGFDRCQFGMCVHVGPWVCSKPCRDFGTVECPCGFKCNTSQGFCMP